MKTIFLALTGGLVSGCGLAIYSTDQTSAANRLNLTVSVAAVRIGERAQFTAKGGKPPYSYQIVSGGGYLGAVDGLFVAAAPPGVSIVRVVDSDRKQTEAAIIVENAAVK